MRSTRTEEFEEDMEMTMKRDLTGEEDTEMPRERNLRELTEDGMIGHTRKEMAIQTRISSTLRDAMTSEEILNSMVL